MKHDKTLIKEAKQESATKSKPTHQTKSFRQLQMKWYEKLEKTGFDDIERRGRNRHKYFDEYNGNLKYSGRSILRGFNSFSLQHLDNCQFFSWHGTSLTKIDRKVLFMYGSGSTLQEISNFLRRFPQHFSPPSNRPGPKGKPFSVYWVHTRLKKLLEQMKVWLQSDEAAQAMGGLEKAYTDTLEDIDNTEQIDALMRNNGEIEC